MNKAVAGITALLSRLQRKVAAEAESLSRWQIVAVTYYGARYGIVTANCRWQAVQRLAEVKFVVENKPLLSFRVPSFAEPCCVASADIVRLIVRGPNEAGIAHDLWDEVCFPRRGVF